jgi:hypothetical protein
MKNLFFPFLIVSSTLLMAFTIKRTILEFQTPIAVDMRPAIEVMMPDLKVPEISIERKDHSSFLNKIGHYESSNDYSRVNRWGYMGKYQFHMETLKAIDIDVSKRKFLSSPVLQEEAMDRLLTANHKNLKRFIKKYEGKVVHGVLVTESGILAAAHLGGAGNVRKWFRKGEDFKDGNGTPITKYMKVFAGYSLELE